MKKRIAKWLIEKLLTVYDSAEILSEYKNRLKSLVFTLYKEAGDLDHKGLDREIADMIFNAKYSEIGEDLGLKTVPSIELSSYYTSANRGDASFLSTPFYRVLTKKKDKEVLNLRYRLKLNQ